MTSWLTYKSDDGVVPRSAAAVILYHQAAASVLLVKRNPALAFMGGHHAFPGGSLSAGDTGVHVRHVSEPMLARCISAGVREVFEETGILLTCGVMPPEETLVRVRRQISASPDVFEAFLTEWGLHIDGAAFQPAGHWITPSFAPMRFDTQYLLYRTEQFHQASALGADAEIVAVEWFSPPDCLRMRGIGEISLSTPIVYALRCLASTNMDAALERLRHTPGYSDMVMDFIEPIPGIHIVPVRSATLPPDTHTNCVIVGESEVVIIDPGFADEAECERFRRHLDDLMRVFGSCVKAILLTHDHPDHNQGADALSAHYGAPVFMGSHDFPTQQKHEPLEDDMVITLLGEPPWRIRCLHTPGHHPGHMAFFEETTQTLVCGDMAANPGTILIEPDAGGDMTEYLNSLERLGVFETALTIPAHGVPLYEDQGKEMFLRTRHHRILREKRIEEALNAGAATVEAILDLAYSDTPVYLRPLAARQMQAHLKRLGRTILA